MKFFTYCHRIGKVICQGFLVNLTCQFSLMLFLLSNASLWCNQSRKWLLVLSCPITCLGTWSTGQGKERQGNTTLIMNLHTTTCTSWFVLARVPGIKGCDGENRKVGQSVWLIYISGSHLRGHLVLVTVTRRDWFPQYCFILPISVLHMYSINLGKQEFIQGL